VHRSVPPLPRCDHLCLRVVGVDLERQVEPARLRETRQQMVEHGHACGDVRLP
jgi:hypothetical protein